MEQCSARGSGTDEPQIEHLSSDNASLRAEITRLQAESAKIEHALAENGRDYGNPAEAILKLADECRDWQDKYLATLTKSDELQNRG
jgi:chromosome segregation ATPase